LSQYSFAKKIQIQAVIRKKLQKTLLYEQVTRKMLVKLTPGRCGTQRCFEEVLGVASIF